MDTRQYTESDYVTVKLVQDSPTKRAVIVNEGWDEETNFEGKPGKRFTIQVEMDSKIKKYSPNKTSMENIQKALGYDSKKWLSKTLLFQVVSMPKECVLATVEMT